MPHHHEKKLLPYSAAQIYALVVDIEKYPEFLPWCKGARLVFSGKKELIADLIVGAGPFHEKFTSHVTLDKPRAITVRYGAGPLSHLSTAWTFTPKGPKACEVSFKVDFDLRSPLLRAAMSLFFDKALKRMVAAFESRAEGLYGEG